MARVLFFLVGLICSPMSVTIMVKQKELKKVVTFIKKQNFPDRLRLALYIYDYPNQRDCVYHRVNGKMECIYKTIYPINRLRNIAIENSLTSHFVVFDMDMWPARSTLLLLSQLGFTYQTLLNLPPSYLSNPYFVTIVPAFSLSKGVLETSKCSDLKSCVNM